MPRAATLDLAGSDLERGFLRAHRIALVRRRGCPVFHEIRLRRIELDLRSERLEPFRKFADDLLQGALLDFEIALSGDLLGCGEVVTRLRLVGIGDSRRADFEVAFRLSELLGDRDLLRLDESEIVLRSEHVEISLRDAN